MLLFIYPKIESSGCFMNKLYNDWNLSSSKFFNYIRKLNCKISKPLLNVLSVLILAIINAESVVTADLSKVIKSDSFSSNDDSNQKRIFRFFNNPNLNMNNIFDSVIHDVVSNISNVRHNKLIVTIDHMFTKNNFVTLMCTLRIDNQGIPLLFYTDKTKSNCHCEIEKNSRKKLFSEKFIINFIDQVIDLLSPLNVKIIFLGDRWFFNLKILKHIQDKGHFFCFRAKANSSVKVLTYDKKEGHQVYKLISDFKSNKYHSVYFENLSFGDMHFKANLAISRGIATGDDEEDWYIITNLKPSLAIKTYAKRYGSIEMFFKSQKTNGFYLESTKTKNLHAFENLYGIACLASLWLNIIATDYIKNYKHLKKKINIRFNKKTSTGKLVRILSTFNLGLTLFSKVFNSYIDYNLKFNFKLYM